MKATRFTLAAILALAFASPVISPAHAQGGGGGGSKPETVMPGPHKKSSHHHHHKSSSKSSSHKSTPKPAATPAPAG